MPSAISYHKKRKIVKTVEDIERLGQVADRIWNNRGQYGNQKQAKVNLRTMAEEIRPLDLLRESLFKRLWILHEESDFEFADMEEISREKRFNGRKEVTRVTYCDGVFHYVTTKNDEFQYGYVCTC